MSAIASNGAAEHPICLTLNGQPRTLQVHPWVTLLDLLREQLDLIGTKKAGQQRGQAAADAIDIEGGDLQRSHASGSLT
ncbi:hypothetical protein [Pseudomonas mosselii]